MLTIPLEDVLRATLAEACGNVGFIGLAPDGSAYHVVVPVDLQIARGVLACNRPRDGTPFGGYSGWRYFQCRAYPTHPGQIEHRAAREGAARANGESLKAWAESLGLRVEVVDAKPGGEKKTGLPER